MPDYDWLIESTALAIHEAQLTEHGGTSGIRDLGLSASALARPQNAFAYEEVIDTAGLAAIYALGVIKSHPFVDGNKRVGLALMLTFLDLHELTITSSGHDLYSQIVAAGGLISDEDFIGWVRASVAPTESDD